MAKFIEFILGRIKSVNTLLGVTFNLKVIGLEFSGILRFRVGFLSSGTIIPWVKMFGTIQLDKIIGVYKYWIQSIM